MLREISMSNKTTRRMHADAPPTLALSTAKIGLLDRLISNKPRVKPKTFSRHLIKVARLGGYLARASDPPPGDTVVGAGCRASPIALGAIVGRELVGSWSSIGALRPTRLLFYFLSDWIDCDGLPDSATAPS
jgi:hypothetical protein